jgi:hypothetical protein
MNFRKTGLLFVLAAVLCMAALPGVLRADENALLAGTECPKKVSVLVETVKAAVFLESQFSGQGQAEIVAVKSPISGILS